LFSLDLNLCFADLVFSLIVMLRLVQTAFEAFGDQLVRRQPRRGPKRRGTLSNFTAGSWGNFASIPIASHSHLYLLNFYISSNPCTMTLVDRYHYHRASYLLMVLKTMRLKQSSSTSKSYVCRVIASSI
jgi:hypothetical protein